MIRWRLKTTGYRPIGLDIGHEYIKMIQLAVTGGHFNVLAAEKVGIEIAEDADDDERRRFIAAAIRQMLGRGLFRGRNVVCCLPNNDLKITSFRLAEEQKQQVEDALKKEAGQRFGFDSDREMIQYIYAGNVRQGDSVKNELILFACNNEAVKGYIELLEAGGLRPVGLDPIPCALFRSFERSLRRQEDREQTVVSIDLGSRYTTVVFGRAGEIGFVKQIPIGGQDFDREVAAKLGVELSQANLLRRQLMPGDMRDLPAAASVESDSAAEGELDRATRQGMVDVIGSAASELAREISLCFRYYTVTFRGRRVEHALFTGGGAYDNILLGVLKRRLNMEVEVAQPLKGFDISSVEFDGDRRGLLCEWAVAVGLSLKGWDPDRQSEDVMKEVTTVTVG